MQKTVNWSRLPMAVLFGRHAGNGGLTKILLVMRLTILLLTVAFLQVRATGRAQSVTFSGKDIPLEKVFAAIEQQTGYYVFFNAGFLQNARAVSVNAREMPLRSFLDTVLKDHPFTYQIESKTISLIPRPHSIFDRTDPAPVRIRVTDEQGRPLSGASVRSTKTKRSGITGADGMLTLDVAAGETIEITFVGFEPQSVSIKAQTSEVTVALKVSERVLDEVTVNKGYYSEKQRLSTGNVSKVTAKEISNQPVTSPLVALQGRMPGVDVKPQSGVPGNMPVIRIRGFNSVRYDGGYPLYVIDGVVMDSRNLTTNVSMIPGGYDPLSTLNIENIASIEVLKDADATAIYGSRGANGVILITTKKGNRGKPEFDLNAYQGFGTLPGRLKLLGIEDYLQMRKEAFANSNVTPTTANAADLTFWDQQKNTDWQKELLGKKAGITDVQANISGGSELLSFRAGVAYHREGTLYPGDFAYNKMNGQFNMTYRSANKRLSVGITSNYGRSETKTLSSLNFISSAFRLPPNAPDMLNPDGSLNWGLAPDGTYTFLTNPLAQLRNTVDASLKTLNVTSQISYKISNAVSLRANLGYTDLTGDEFMKYPISAYDPVNIVYATGYVNYAVNQRSSWIVEPQLNYEKKLGDHKLDALIGTTFQNDYAERTAIQAYGYTSDALLNSLYSAPYQAVTADYDRKYRYTAVFARAGYNYREKYLVNITGRRDGSSRFGSNNKFGNFGSIGAAWIISDEPFMREHVRFLSFAKFRTSFGITGNDQIGDYKYYNTYSGTTYAYNGQANLSPKALFNPDFRWEQTMKQEYALQLGWLKDRINLDVSYYNHTTSNQLIEYQLPLVTGFMSVLMNMPAVIRNKGWEFSLHTRNIAQQHFTWNSSVNFTFSDSRLVQFDDLASSPYAMYMIVGQPISILKLYRFLGVDPQTGLYEVEDVNKDGQFDDADKVVIRNNDRVVFGGMSNEFRLKKFGLMFLVQAGIQGTTLFQSTTPGSRANMLQQDYDDMWRKPGDIARLGKPVVKEDFSSRVRYSTSDAMYPQIFFARLNTLTFSYDFDSRFLDRLKLKSCRLFFHGQNLYTFADGQSYNPEMRNESVPVMRTFSLGLNLKF